jgi:hypothetical protein
MPTMRVNGAVAPGHTEIRWKPRWRRLPRWACVFPFMRHKYAVYVANTVQPKGSRVVIMYEISKEDHATPDTK